MSLVKCLFVLSGLAKKMLTKELKNKLEIENMDRCRACFKFKVCKINKKQIVVDCEEFEEVDDSSN